MKQKVIYLSAAQVLYIYEDLKANGYYEFYITLKIIDEAQLDYTFLAKLSWKDLLSGDEVVDVSGIKNKTYYLSEDLRDEIESVLEIMNVYNLNDKIIKTSARELIKHLCTYERIRHYKESFGTFRIDFFREYSVDVNGIKTYMMRTIDDLDDIITGNENVSLCFLYVATFWDKFHDKRPEQFKLNWPDKKIGISKVIEERMDNLSKDKNHGGTLSPLYVKALRAWVLPTKLCKETERLLHKYFEERKSDNDLYLMGRTEGEWFTDYSNDLILYVEKHMKKLKRQGHQVIKVDINETNDDVSYVYELKKSFKDELIIEEVSEGIKLQM